MKLKLDLPIGMREEKRLELTVGKIDPFVFFDQNAAADDESERFLNNVFVHNPMVDSRGAVGADDYGFSPGVRVAFLGETTKPDWWQVSLGVFGAGDAASFGNRLEKPLVIGQLDYGTKLFGGLDCTYRVYAWRNGQYEGYDASTGTTTGWGASIDQRVTNDLSLFTRYGQSNSGKTAFDRAVTLGGELAGTAWGRGADGLGFAYGWLRSNRGFRRDTAADPSLAGIAADGAEQIAELYYRWRVNEQLALTPDLQHVRRAAGDRDSKHITAVGLRALYAF
ncbi:MAG TPA: carbohydrate porin [Rhodocyclaceae bacterium]|nr:carbohydrate porin [Rhodocyclaceae bacterium]